MKVETALLSDNERMLSYQLLADCYYLPDEKLLRRLCDLGESVGGSFLKVIKHIPIGEELKVLAVDFSRLFVGPFKLLAPPYGSVYLENSRTIMSGSTIDVRNSYQQEGLRIDLKEAPDHIAIELEFMYFLIFRPAQAIKNSDSQSAGRYLKKQASFLEAHLGRWISEFTDKVVANSQTLFYRKLAQATRLFIQDDLKNIYHIRTHPI